MAGKSTQKKGAKPAFDRRMRGFERAGGLLSSRIRKAGEGRGFAVSRLLTQWPEVAGQDLAQCTRPVRISYGRGGMGATLTLLTTGAQALMVQAELPKLRDRVNACYGYAAISKINLTQTAAEGFAEGKASFDHRPATTKTETTKKLQTAAGKIKTDTGVADPGLRQALENMGGQIFARRQTHDDE